MFTSAKQNYHIDNMFNETIQFIKLSYHDYFRKLDKTSLVKKKTQVKEKKEEDQKGNGFWGYCGCGQNENEQEEEEEEESFQE